MLFWNLQNSGRKRLIKINKYVISYIILKTMRKEHRNES